MLTYHDIPIVFEDNHLLVVVKPANVPVMADETGDPDLVNILKSYLKERYDKPGEAYLGLVHRLDRPTGGVMVFAKTSKAAARLSEQIRNGTTEKRYFAIVEGTPRFKTDKLVNYLKKFPETNTVKVVPELTEGAKYAELDYKVLAEREGFSLLQVNLVTGRAHQIRVQLATIGNPILGDKKYGSGGNFDMCLWAVQLKFVHPISGRVMTFRVFPPENQLWSMFDLDGFLSVTLKNE